MNIWTRNTTSKECKETLRRLFPIKLRRGFEWQREPEAYLYALRDGREPMQWKYIGCTRNPLERLRLYLRDSVYHSPRVGEWLRSIGDNIEIQILAVIPLKNCLEYETNLIRVALQNEHPLLNESFKGAKKYSEKGDYLLDNTQWLRYNGKHSRKR